MLQQSFSFMCLNLLELQHLQSSNTRKIDLYGVLQVHNYVYEQELIDIPMDYWISVSLDTKDVLCKGGSGFVQAIDLKHVLYTTVF